MKCERAMELLATGTALGRMRARRHAARCPNCATEIGRLARIATVLTTVQPLTQAQRALWTSASTEPRPAMARSASPWPRRGRLSAAAAVLFLAVGLALVALRPSPAKRPGQPIVEPVAILEKPRRQGSLEVMQELDTLSSNLNSLSQELAQLSRQAELLDERGKAEALAQQFLAMNHP